MNAAQESRPEAARSDLEHRLHEIEQIGDVSLRIIEYKRLVEELPAASSAAFDLAVALWNDGQREEACNAAGKAIAVTPGLRDRLPRGLASALHDTAAAQADIPVDRLGQVVAGFRVAHCIAEDPRTLLYQVERGSERGYLRVLRPSLSQDPSVPARFLSSAELLRRAPHPGLATILDIGTLPDGCAYLLMRPAPGEPLSERIWRAEPLAPLAPALRDLAEALAMLHARGLCYLAIQPERIQVAAGATPAMQLLDSEHVRGETLQLPQPTIASGAVRKGVDPVLFMAPESFSGRADVGPPADVYQLGVLAYFLLCERPPFVGEREGEVIAAHINQSPVPVRSLAPHVPEELARLVEAMLDKVPGNRPPMARVAEDLARLFAAPVPRAVAPPPASEPQQIGDYRLIRKIGEGRTGQVFEAYNERLHRHDAIKLIRPELSRSQEDADRFLHEVQAANQVAHPGIISILQQARTPSGQIYTVMEYLPGGNLRDRIKRGPIPPEQVQRLCRHVALAVAAAHEHGVIHRDLKPENVQVVSDPDVPGGERTKVVDFGTANLTQAPSRGPYVEGTPPYMSPEQLRDTGTSGAKTDVFALGVMMNEMLVGGWRPGQSRAPAGCPRRLASLLQRMQDPDPNLRPTMQYVADALACAPKPWFSWSRAGIAALIASVAGVAVLAGLHFCSVETYTLTVSKTGDGSVVMAGNGSGIDCGTGCDEAYERGARVTLVATPTSGSMFGEWGGCDSTAGATCNVTMNAAKTVSATFRPVFTLTVVNGTDKGTVTAAGIDCGTDCSETYPSGTPVTLKVTPASVLGNWSGCESTVAATCKVIMNAAKTVTASLRPSYLLTVAKAGKGKGKVTEVGSASGISCGSDCRKSYLNGTVVKLIAIPASPSVFGEWSGCTSTSGATCRVTLDAAKTVTATFGVTPPHPPVANSCVASETRCVAGDLTAIATCRANTWTTEHCYASQCSKAACRTVCDITTSLADPTFCLFPNGDHVNDGDWIWPSSQELSGTADGDAVHQLATGGYALAPVSPAGSQTWPYAWRITGSDYVLITFKLRAADSPRTPVAEFRAKGTNAGDQGNGYRIRIFNGPIKDDTLIAECAGGTVPPTFADRKCSIGPPFNAQLDYHGGWNTIELSATGDAALDVNWFKLTLQP